MLSQATENIKNFSPALGRMLTKEYQPKGDIILSMKFSEFSQYLEKLETTSSRIELTNILSELLKQIATDEIDKAVYLLRGRVAPFFEPIEIGMADKMVELAIAEAYDKPREEVKKLIAQVGDHGLAAEKLSLELKAKSSNLPIKDVFEILYKIAITSGEGSVERKIFTLVDLLKEVDAVSAKYLVRIPLSKMRLGVGDPTIIDALSLAKKGDKTHRQELEAAYNKTSDLGFLAKTYWTKGISAINKTHLMIGKPVRPALAERLPSPEEMVKRLGDEFAAEPKYDGFRVQLHLSRKNKDKQVQIFSRNLENMTAMFPDLVKGVLTEVKADEAIFEGEALAYNPVTEEFYPFQETTKRRRKYDIEEVSKKLPLKVFLFDLLYLNGKDITGEPYTERRKALTEITKETKDGIVLVAKEKLLHTVEELKEFFEEQISAGLEGLMVKKLDSPYEAGGRGYHWIKFKRTAAGALEDSIDCVLLGIYTGTGKRTEFGVGGLLVGLYDSEKDEFVTVSRVGTGLTDSEFRKVNEIGQKAKVDHKPARVNSKIEPSYWVEPREVLEIFADEITVSPIHTAGYALRFPRLVSFRGSDKRAEDATTVKELIDMYQVQKKVKVT